MEQKLNLTSLSREQLMMVNGGEITKDTSAAYDLYYIFGLTLRSYYEFVVGAASFQASLPPNLKK
ncbi:MAG TPA: hypothetical protein VK589_02720 [Chryseolinea sp.]|nr:hypothetical protein [Chryseolinea sp.]